MKKRRSLSHYTSDSQFLSPKELANVMEVHLMTVYRHARLKKLPFIKIGGQWRMPLAEFERMCKDE